MSEVKYSLVPTQSLVRSSCQSTVSLVVGKLLHKHPNRSEIHQGCLRSNPVNCPYVIKVKELHTQDELNAFLQEQFFAQYVNEEFRARKNAIGSKLTGITPQIHDVWTCHQDNDRREPSHLRGFMVMDQMEGTLQQFVHRYASVLTQDDYAKITLHLLHIFHVLTQLGILHQKLTLNHLVYRRVPQPQTQPQIRINGHPGAIELFIIDWDKVVWRDDKKVPERYDRILSMILLRMEREQARALKMSQTFKIPIQRLSDLESAQSFQPIRPAPSSMQLQPQPLTTSSFVFSSSAAAPTIPIEIKAPSIRLPIPTPTPSPPPLLEEEQEERESPYEYLPPVSPPLEGFDQEEL